MGKRVLVISASLRLNSNSDVLAAEFARGAKDAGHEVETISLRDHAVTFCKSCLACQKSGRCVIPDDGNAIVEKMLTADVIVFATPIYYYEMSGQMKTMLDRANPLFPSDYSFRDVYLLTTAADADQGAAENAANGLAGWVSCFEKARLAGTVFGGGADGAGEIQGHPAMQEAYDMGKKV